MEREFDGTERKVAEFIHEQDLFADAERVLVAVSGGADSMALLHILKALTGSELAGIELVCAHVNHRLRGQAADADERFVVQAAADLGLPVVAKSADVQEYAATRRLSVETAGRQLRLGGLAEVAREHGCTWIATGHHKNDNAETLVHRLLRGTGLRGLAGILPARRLDEDLALGRPLLCLSRAEVIPYLERHGQGWREDHTNASAIHTRNYIRHRLLPALQEQAQTPLVEELTELAAAAAKLRRRIGQETDAAWPELVETAGDRLAIAAKRLKALPEPVAIELIRRALVRLGSGERDLTQHHYRKLLQLARTDATRLSLPRGFSAGREGDSVVLRNEAFLEPTAPALPTSAQAIQIPGRTCFAGFCIQAEIVHAHGLPGEGPAKGADRWCEHLDLDRIKGPVTMRGRRPGDRFQPLGLAGPTKVGKFLTAAKVPPHVREQILLFADSKRILWVCPIRISERAKITAETRNVLRLRVTTPCTPGESEI